MCEHVCIAPCNVPEIHGDPDQDKTVTEDEQINEYLQSQRRYREFLLTVVKM